MVDFSNMKNIVIIIGDAIVVKVNLIYRLVSFIDFEKMQKKNLKKKKKSNDD